MTRISSASTLPDIPDGLRSWAALDGPAAVLDAVRDRARRGHSTESGTLRVQLAPVHRRELARLLGTAWDTSGRPVTLQRLARALAEDGFTVRGFVEGLDGQQLVDERAVRREARLAAVREREEVAALVAGSGVSAEVVDVWVTDPGLPRPGDGRLRDLAAMVVQVWRHLPWTTRSGVRLATLAGAVLADAHGLDHDRELGRAVCRLVALHCGLPRPLRQGRDWRRAWMAAGVLCDEVSSRVLVLNLPLVGAAPAARLCAAAHGEPLWLTLRSLAGDWMISPGTVVRVCENPTVVEAAADRFGPNCPPLLCTDGVPSFAALDLVTGLARAGARLAVRADVDDNGFVTVDQLLAADPGSTLWRFDAVHYARQLGVDEPDQPGTDVEPLLQQLRALHRRYRIAAHEEAILDDLLDDLRRPADV